MSTVNEARRVWEETRAGFEPVRILYKGKMGKGDGTVEDASRPNYVWVRIGNQTAYAVFNVRVAPYNDLPVLIGRTPDLPDTDQVLGVDWGEWLDKWTSPFLPRHGITHAWNGADPTWIDKRAITSLLVRATDPASMRVIVLGTERYPWGTGWHEFYTSLSDDLTSRIPGAGEHRLVLLSIDAASNSLQYTNGAAVPEAMIATAPTPPAGCIPLACVELTNGMSTITQDEITDYRIMWDTVADGASPWGNVIVVAKSGGDYDNLPDAVAAASDGDAIVMMEGVYNDAVTIDKKLLIRVGSTPLSTFLDSSVGRVEISGDVTITEACQLRGIAVSGAFTVSVGAYQKWIGAEHCSFDTTAFVSAVGSQVWIKLVDCYVDGEIGLDFSEATDGEVHIYGCESENVPTFPVDHGAADLYTGWSSIGTITGTGTRTTIPDRHYVKTAATATPIQVMDWVADSTGAPAAGFGARHLFSLESGAGEGQDAAALDVQWSDPASGSEDSYIRWLIRVAGAALAEAWRLNETGVVLPSGFDVYPDGNAAGAQERENCWLDWDEHFDVSSLPAGWNWAADGAGDFTAGAPGTVNFSINSLFKFGGAAGTNAFCYRSITSAYDAFFTALMSPIGLSLNEVGIRIDDSTDPANHYVELFIDYVVGAGARIVGQYNDGGGETSTTWLTNQAVQHFFVLLLATSGAAGNWKINVRLGSDYGAGHVGTLGVGKAWTPNRVGIYIKNTSAGNRYALVDACRGTMVTW